MGRKKEMLSLLLLIIINLSNAEVFYNVIKQQDPCINIMYQYISINEVVDSEEKHVINSCQRGCRFFNLVELRRQLEPNNINSTLDACDASCTEAYLIKQEQGACRIGCILMASHRVNDLTSLFSLAIRIEDGIRPNILLMSPDISENEVLTDPGLGKELLPGWWDSNDFKLPQTYFKTVPIDSGTVDYGVSSEYLGEYEKSTSLPGSDWLQCASRHTGIPRWLLALAIATAALSTLWLCLSPEKPNDSIEKVTLVKPSSPSKVTIYLPDEAPLLKKPPPKYSEVDTNDLNLPV